MFKHILVATDGTRFSLKAVKIAVGLASKLGARLSAVHVLPATAYDFVGDIVSTRLISPAEARSREARVAKTVFRSLNTMAATARVKLQAAAVTSDDVHDSIVAAAKKNRCDLIVMASHGRRGLAGLLLGSETQKVVTHSKIPVLVCR